MTHVGVEGGVVLTSGCEWAVRLWTKNKRWKSERDQHGQA